MRHTFDAHFAVIISEVADLLRNEQKSHDNASNNKKNIRKNAQIIVAVEVAVRGLQKLLPEYLHNTEELPYIFSFTPNSHLKNFDPDQQKVWQNLQILMPSWKTKKRIEASFEKYSSIGNSFKHVRVKDKKISWKNMIHFPDRLERYDELLSSTLKHSAQKKLYATTGKMMYFNNFTHRKQEINVPKAFCFTDNNEALKTEYAKTEKISFTKQELLFGAKEMDSKEVINGGQSRQWEERVRDLLFLKCGEKQILDTDEITIENTQHWVGTLSSGKSTIIDVLSYLLATRGELITIVVGDNADLLNKIDMYKRLGIKAVPIISPRNKEKHINDYLQSIQFEIDSLADLKRPAFRYLSPSCQMKNLITEDMGEPPCFNVEQGNEKKICPFYQKCEYHNAYHDLPSANILIATIQGLVYSPIPPTLSTKKMRMLEYVIRRSSLIFVDEADRVQANIDEIFAPNEEIAGRPQSWFESINRKINDFLMQYKSPLENHLIEEWIVSLQHAMSSVYIAYAQLQQEKDVFDFVGKQFFNGYKLLKQIALDIASSYQSANGSEQNEVSNTSKHLHDEKDIEADPIFQEIWNHFKDFLTAYNEEDVERLSNNKKGKSLVEITNLINDVNLSKVLIGRYIKKLTIKHPIPLGKHEQLSKKLRFALTIVNMETKLAFLLNHLNEIQADFAEAGMQFLQDFTLMGPPKDFIGLIPTAPSGTWLGFKYSSEHKDYGHNVILSLIRYMGVGRYILTNMHSLYKRLDGNHGAHCVLLSGTSYAPGSSKYHIDLPVSYLVKKANEIVTPIGHSFRTLFYTNNKPIIVSGVQGSNRIEALKESIKSMVATNMISNIIKTAPRGRERIVCIVGSYEEAKTLGQYFREIWQERNHVYYLVNNIEEAKEEGSWPRQRISSFAQSGGKILIAPLLALERGHNILTEVDGRRVSAIEAVIFMIRPYPIPFDLSRVVHQLNAYSIHQFNLVKLKPSDSLKEEVLALYVEAIRIQKENMKLSLGYLSLTREKRENLIMELGVNIWQLEGRVIRGNVPARVFFTDSKFAPNSAIRKTDNILTSMLIGWKEQFNKLSRKRNIESQIIQELYGPLINGLNLMEGVIENNNEKAT